MAHPGKYHYVSRVGGVEPYAEWVSMLTIDNREIDAVLFDAGGIFVIPDPTVLAPLLTYFGATNDLDAYHRAHYRGMAAKSSAGSPEGDWSQYDLAYVQSVGVHNSEHEHAASILGKTRNAWLWRWPLPDSVAALREMHRRNIPIGVVSNASGQIEEILSRSKVCQVGDGDAVPVSVIVDSHLVGIAKPDPRIFDFGLAALGSVDRSRVAYVGDSVTMDVGGARSAGLFPVLLDPHDDHPGADFHRVRSLLELL